MARKEGDRKGVKQKYGGMYGEGVKKRYREDLVGDKMEVEGVIKKFIIGGVLGVSDGDNYFIIAEVGEI